MIAHWLFNQNICALTLAEKYIKKKLGNYDDDDCFTCKLIEPVYDFKNNYKAYSILIYVITIMLWLLSSGKLLYKWKSGHINNIYDLIKI